MTQIAEKVQTLITFRTRLPIVVKKYYYIHMDENKSQQVDIQQRDPSLAGQEPSSSFISYRQAKTLSIVVGAIITLTVLSIGGYLIYQKKVVPSSEKEKAVTPELGDHAIPTTKVVKKKLTAIPDDVDISYAGRDVSAEYGVKFSLGGENVAYVLRENDKWSVVYNGVKQKSYDAVTDRTFSPDGMHFAYLVRKGTVLEGKWAVVLDGQESQFYDRILSQTFSPNNEFYYRVNDKKNVFYMIGNKKSNYSPIFSPDGSQLVYQGSTENGKQFLIVDEKRSEEYDELRTLQGVGGIHTLTFNPTGKGFAYAVSKKLTDGSREIYVIAEGKKYGPYHSVINRLIYSPDGTQIAFYTNGDNIDNDVVVIENGIERKKNVGNVINYELQFSPDSKHIAYLSEDEEKYFVILDEKVVGGPFYILPNYLTFSPNSKQFAFSAQEEGRWSVYIDGEKSNGYVAVGRPVFSPDGTKYAFAASDGDKLFYVFNGEESQIYDFPWESSGNTVRTGGITAALIPVFSPDGNHVAWRAGHNVKEDSGLIKRESFVVLDGKEGTHYASIRGPVFQFTPDSKTFIYTASYFADSLSEKGDDVLVINNQENQRFNDIDEFSFTLLPNNEGFSYGARIGRELYFVKELFE